jgi:hypothetical protein
MTETAETHVIKITSPGISITARMDRLADVAALAEALHEARPTWQMSIDGKQPVFSREGAVVDLIGRRSDAA